MSVCVWSWAMSDARITLMTRGDPMLCFVFFFSTSTALIRQEPLCSTAHLINEEQPCASADTAAHTFECKTLGSSRLCGKSWGCVRVHNNTHVFDILLIAHCPSISLHHIPGYPKLLCIMIVILQKKKQKTQLVYKIHRLVGLAYPLTRTSQPVQVCTCM